MYISAETLDDLLIKVYRRLLRSKGDADINPTKGLATEINGALLQLRNPRARLSRTERKNTLFSCLGEFLWYLAGSNDLKFIQYYIPKYDEYSDDGETIFGAYGPRLFSLNGKIDQLKNVVETLKKNGESRRAVVQLFRGEDLAADLVERKNDLPCTCTLQFTLRKHQLHMLVMMRSNDAFKGLPHDVFAFTMLQEIIARTLEVEVGLYKHAVGSLHLYATDTQNARDYLEEGVQERLAMPAMPWEDPAPSIETLVYAEHAIRTGGQPKYHSVDPYWEDLIRLLSIFRYSKIPTTKYPTRKIRDIKSKMNSDFFDIYIQRRENRLKQSPVVEEPLLFDGAALDAQQPINTHAKSDIDEFRAH
ncbi:MAG: thymidylate synthase [Achromobacter pulmonis]